MVESHLKSVHQYSHAVNLFEESLGLTLIAAYIHKNFSLTIHTFFIRFLNHVVKVPTNPLRVKNIKRLENRIIKVKYDFCMQEQCRNEWQYK